MGDISIEVGSRMHLGLVSMHAGGPRRNGGVGFAIQRPTTTVLLSAASDIYFSDVRSGGLGRAEQDQLHAVLQSIRCDFRLLTGMTITLSGSMPTHRGFGSGTAIRLACIEGLFALNDRALTAEELVRLSKRGGTSGIGITTYFSGGLVVDLGVGWSLSSDFVPSSAVEVVRLPLTLGRIDMPDWIIGVLLAPRYHPKVAGEELEFFRRVAPLRRVSSYEAAYHAVFGVYAAALESDLSAFCSAIDALQKTDWKKAERAEYGSRLVDLDAALRDRGAMTVGMSSLGPALFFLGEPDAMAEIEKDAQTLGSEVTLTAPKNSGRTMLR